VSGQDLSAKVVTPGALMKTAVLARPGEFRIQDGQVPVPAAGQVRVRVEGCGICGSNLPPWEGRPWFDYPFPAGAPGHEAWGVIDMVGEGVAGIEPGTTVAALSYHGFADYDIAQADQVVPIPAALRRTAVPGEPLGCAVNVFHRSAIAAGQTVVIIGIGFLGALLTQLAAAAGARVIAVSRRPFALEIARQAGAAETIPIDGEADVQQALVASTDGAGADCVIEAVGSQRALDVASHATRVRGRLVIAGYHQDGPRQIDMQLWNWRGLDVVNAHERDPAVYVSGMREALAAVAAGTLRPAELITHVYRVDELGDAFRVAQERPDGFLKAVVVP
jgi:threonine dehydrogenase-like Zn-dependent dehydrogenase